MLERQDVAEGVTESPLTVAAPVSGKKRRPRRGKPSPFQPAFRPGARDPDVHGKRKLDFAGVVRERLCAELIEVLPLIDFEDPRRLSWLKKHSVD
jgi:hypothetical protein